MTFDLSQLSILSQVLHTSEDDGAEIPHFSSVTPKVLSSHHASGDSLSGSQNLDELNYVNVASSSRDSVPLKMFYNYRSASELLYSSHRKHILKDLRAFMSLERPENGSLHLSHGWFGSCSLPGFDITLSLSEIQVIISSAIYSLSAVVQAFFPRLTLFSLCQTIVSMTSSFYGTSSQKTSRELNRNNGTARQEFNNNLEAIVPDGTQNQIL